VARNPLVEDDYSRSHPKYPCADVEEIYPVLEQGEELAELLDVVKYGFESEAGSLVTEGAGRTDALLDNLQRAVSFYAHRSSEVRSLDIGQANTLIQYLSEKGYLKRDPLDRFRWDAVQEPDRLAEIISHNHCVEVGIKSGR